jgi:hypothetical protein
MLRPSGTDLETRPIFPRNPWPNGPRPLSVPVDARPAALLEDTETATQWSPHFFAAAAPYFGGHDELSERGRGIMHVAQAGTYDASPNPWPNNGQYDRPNGLFAIFQGLMQKPPESSAHRGFSMPTGPGPSMLFHAPPIFSLQQQPIPAVGV